jgi:argininosuccinate lyase
MRSGRFQKGMEAALRRLNASVAFDRRLYREDIEGSLAWAEALAKQGVLSGEELLRVQKGLERVRAEIDAGAIELDEELEDIHMNVEARLTEIVGPVGGKLHTGRSRNDQVATDLRLHLMRVSSEFAGETLSLAAALVEAAEREIGVVMPAYTHLQRAQPVLFSHHLLAYAEMFLRDRGRFLWAAAQADACPLGSGACVGNQFGIDREFLRERLGFSRLTRNSLDAVSDRDFACDFLHACALFMVHVSRLSEDLILWSTSEFGFVSLDDSVSSGSSLLPQKKNPDACELGRGKAGRVFGHLIGLLTVLKGLPLSYNKDLQEDKEGVFDAVDTLRLLFPVFHQVISTLRVHSERTSAALASGFLEALSVADYLTRRGLPFRDAHKVAGSCVRRAEELGVSLAALPLEEYSRLYSGFGPDFHRSIAERSALEDKDVVGGTAPRRVEAEIRRLKELLAVCRSPHPPAEQAEP